MTLPTTLFALLLGATLQAGTDTRPASAPADNRAAAAVPDNRAIRIALKSAERMIDGRVQQMTDRVPFALLGTTRAAYLSGYGAVFTLEVNLAPVANISPFRPAYTPKEIQDLNRQKREKLGLLKTGLRQILLDQAAALSQLPAQEKVAVVVSLFNFHWENTSGLPTQLVLQASRQALLEVQAKRGGPEALDRAIETREF